jgi:electron transport complex protein RnfG
MKEFLKPAIVLLAVCFVTVGIVSAVNDITKDRIAALEEEAKQEYMEKVLPAADSFETTVLNEKDAKFQATVLEVNKGFKGQEVAGCVYLVKTSGYGGDIVVVVGIDKSGAVSGVVVGDNNETPGVGREAAKPDFVNRFIGAREANLKVTKKGGNAANEIDALSGATVTSNALTRAVNAALNHYIEKGV